MKKVTLKDIAAKAGVSAALVSNYINQRPSARMSPETKIKIDKVLKELDYHGSAIARSLRTGKSNIIGYISEALRTEVSRQEMMAVFDAAAKENYQVFVAFSSARDKTLSNIRMLKERGCDGIIVSGYFDEDFSQQICMKFKPVVILNTHPSAMMPGKILHYDYRSAINEAINHLQSMGHKNIYYQTPVENSYDQRFLEFIKFFGEKKVWYPSAQIPSAEEFGDFMNQHKDCTAMLHLNDFMALQTIRNCNYLGINVPEEFSVIGFDNITAADYTIPKLSTVSRPLEEAAHHAVISLLKQLKYEKYNLPESLPCKFIKRDSTAKIIK